VALDDGGLVLATGSVEAREASTGSGGEVADTTAGAVSSSLVAVAIEGVGAGGALLLVAGGASVPSVAEASDVLHGVPGLLVYTRALGGQMFLGPAGSSVIAVVGADGSLASNTFVAGEALAGTNLAVAEASVRALRPGMEIVGIDDSANPGKVLGAGSQGAVGAGPLGLAVETDEAVAVVIHLAGAVVGAVVLAESAHAVSLLVPSDLTPALLVECGHGGRIRGRGRGRFSGVRRGHSRVNGRGGLSLDVPHQESDDCYYNYQTVHFI